MKLCIDNENFNCKPTNTGAVSNRLVQQMVDLPIKEVATILVQPFGNTWTPAYFKPDSEGKLKRTNECWGGQTLFALDFDNKDKMVTIEEVLKRCREYNIPPAFSYSTFSSTNNDKFRVVWQTPFEITDARVRNVIQIALLEIFPECDRSCKDASRMFFGGKELIHTDFAATIDIEQLVESMCRFVTVHDKHDNYSRQIKDFCKQVGLDMVNNLPYIETVVSSQNLTESGANPSLYIYIRITRNPVKNGVEETVVLHFNENATESSARVKKTKYNVGNVKTEREVIEHVDFEKLAHECQLYREFINGTYWAYHSEIFGIATNLLSAKGGREKFMQGIKSHPEYDEEKWSFYANYINKRAYLPQQCDKFCPFSDSCQHGKNMIEQVRLVRGRVNEIEKPMLKPLCDAENELARAFSDALNSDGTDIHVIKAPPGIGKTKLYLPLKQVTIAVPTHKLKSEVVQKMEAIGNKPITTPQLPLLPVEHTQKIEKLYATGAYESAGKYIKSISGKYLHVGRYLSDLEAVKINHTNATILTTHERLLYLKDTNDTIVIDEDILPTLLKIDSMLPSDLAMVLCNMRNSTDKQVLRYIWDDIEKSVPNIVYETPSFFLENAKAIETFVSQSSSVSTNVLDFLNSSHYVKVADKDGSVKIFFINRRGLPNKKIIILSATANETVYKLLFGDRLKFIDIGQVETKGKIIQYPQYSFSKARLNDDKKFLSLAKAIVGREPVITYKNYADEFENCICTFGNTEGFDSFAGKDIFVVGALHANPIVYLLMSNALGHKPKANDCQLKYVPVRRNGFEFYFNTFSDDDVLREIQMYIVESELVQAIGRARILRNDCLVTVLSNFPIVGADLRYLSQEDIKKLLVNDKKELEDVA